ncbi:sulfotransferase domain family protein [Heliomicrobium modesticaldum Ice1]|uniref:Sulfotransferase domain family protein n=1 Tax=Heliobacterium modesticaldum (strain ATCC 51547 / Ice1) TaxID=498761 RepID=B0THH3_HELMI|nr:sulfotransferase domain-containing protein [Heliomicrobium modesticaldum]ABZ83411.1 sulfotransferase domain family protein [Heliomicrobium modesticaldum Ice1]
MDKEILRKTVENVRELIDTKNYRIADTILEELLTEHPHNPEINYLLAYVKHVSGFDLHLAIDYYNQSLVYGFDEYWVRYHRAQLYHLLGNTESAIKDLEIAISINENNVDAKNILNLINGNELFTNKANNHNCEFKVLVNSIPKAGTNLLTTCINSIKALRYSGYHVEHEEPHQLITIFDSLRKGQYVSSHLYPTYTNVNIVEKNKFKTLLMVRDPRDVVVSWVNYATKKEYVRYTDYLIRLKDDHQRLLTGISGVSRDQCSKRYGQEDIGTVFREYLKWNNYEYNLMVRYEDLIGPEGNGSKEKQIQQIEKVLRHLGITIPNEQILVISNKVFNVDSPTFRKGIIGDWKNHFSDEHKKAFKEIAGDVLITLGYEENYDW